MPISTGLPWSVSRSTDREFEEELGRLVCAAVRRNLGDSERTIFFLSGGANSRGILGGALRAAGGDGSSLSTVTWGVDQGSDDSDGAVAGRVAAMVGSRHRFFQRSLDNYADNFSRVNGLIDSSEIAAYHPHEYRIMQALRADGFERALRGDEVFGWSIQVPTAAGALGKVFLRRLRDDPALAAFVRPEHYHDWCGAADATVDAAAHEVHDWPVNAAKDRGRLAGVEVGEPLHVGVETSPNFIDC